MGLFSRSRDSAGPADDESVPDDSDLLPLVPTSRPLRPQDRELLERGRGQLAATGVDLDDLAAIGAAHDADLAAWAALPERRRDDHAAHVDLWGVAVGEYLARHTDLRWTTVADPFGTDLGLMAAGEPGESGEPGEPGTPAVRDDFAVIPTNLVSGRWLNGETGWIPGVVGHLVRLRTR
jgi:hypothetical protein